MPKLLHIDASPMGGQSVSRHLTHQFVDAWKRANPGGAVTRRDLSTTALRPIDAEWVAAAYTPPANRSAEQRTRLALSDALIEELHDADEIVIGSPMHNFTIASGLKLWIDLIARAGETFSYGENGPEGLLKGKKATVIVAYGGVYTSGTRMEAYNFVEPYLRAVLGFLGIADVHFHVADGAAQLNSGKVNREDYLQSHTDVIHERVAITHAEPALLAAA